jgi:NAD(P)-dependent dehydrogenase (short-subunit alcohol dehydrogenase family)
MAKQPRSLTGKVAAITGGARGIGRATAQALAREGVRVAIGDLDRELAEQAAAGVGAGAIGLDLNVADRDSFAAFLDETERALGPIDILVNNAGIMPLGSFVEETDATARRQIDINLHGVIFGSKLALQRMRPRNSGHIVNIASTAGKAGFPGAATYCATKHAVVGLTEAMRAELRVDNVDVDLSVIMPGVVNTELTAGVAQGRAVKFVEPEDVADAIVDALKFNRFDVFVPKSISGIIRGTTLLPRSAAEAVSRFLKADQILWKVDKGKRAGYEDRAAHSEPDVDDDAAKRVEAEAAS